MRERAEQVGGQLTILTEHGRGTEVEAVVPVAIIPAGSYV
jgi:signal transduction histidine kinase